MKANLALFFAFVVISSALPVPIKHSMMPDAQNGQDMDTYEMDYDNEDFDDDDDHARSSRNLYELKDINRQNRYVDDLEKEFIPKSTLSKRNSNSELVQVLRQRDSDSSEDNTDPLSRNLQDRSVKGSGTFSDDGQQVLANFNYPNTFPVSDNSSTESNVPNIFKQDAVLELLPQVADNNSIEIIQRKIVFENKIRIANANGLKALLFKPDSSISGVPEEIAPLPMSEVAPLLMPEVANNANVQVERTVPITETANFSVVPNGNLNNVTDVTNAVTDAVPNAVTDAIPNVGTNAVPNIGTNAVVNAGTNAEVNAGKYAEANAEANAGTNGMNEKRVLMEALIKQEMEETVNRESDKIARNGLTDMGINPVPASIQPSKELLQDNATVQSVEVTNTTGLATGLIKNNQSKLDVAQDGHQKETVVMPYSRIIKRLEDLKSEQNRALEASKDSNSDYRNGNDIRDLLEQPEVDDDYLLDVNPVKKFSRSDYEMNDSKRKMRSHSGHLFSQDARNQQPKKVRRSKHNRSHKRRRHNVNEDTSWTMRKKEGYD